MAVLDATLIIPDNLYCVSKVSMRFWTRSPRRSSESPTEALARVEAQRGKLESQLVELEATERVLARYSKGSGARR